MESHIRAWHGAHRWTPPPQIRPSRSGRFEYGPGIYGTTRLANARKYAKGGGMVHELLISPAIGLAQTREIPIAAFREYIKTSKPRFRSDLTEDLDHYLESRKLRATKSDHISAESVLNICLNNQNMVGATGPSFAEWLVTAGVHASITKLSDQDIIVIFDPSKILDAIPRPTDSIDWTASDLPRINEQLKKTSA